MYYRGPLRSRTSQGSPPGSVPGDAPSGWSRRTAHDSTSIEWDRPSMGLRNLSRARPPATAHEHLRAPTQWEVVAPPVCDPIRRGCGCPRQVRLGLPRRDRLLHGRSARVHPRGWAIAQGSPTPASPVEPPPRPCPRARPRIPRGTRQRRSPGSGPSALARITPSAGLRNGRTREVHHPLSGPTRT